MKRDYKLAGSKERRGINRRMAVAGMLALLLLAATVGLYLQLKKERTGATYSDIRDPVERALVPFWKGTTMYGESLLMVADGEKPPEASLLFTPLEIVSVTNAGQDIVYEPGVDWLFENGKLKLPEGSRIPMMKKSRLYPRTHIPGMDFAKKGGGYVLYREGSFFHEQQVSVTYTHRANEWKGPVPSLAERAVKRTIGRLRAGEPLKLILYGDSIAEGQNASGITGAAPYLPSWGELLVEALKRNYASELIFENPSVGGKDSAWGKAEARALVAERRPDLAILAFGMNDGTLDVPPEQFRSNIQDIVDQIRSANPDVEFIVVSTSLPNPETEFLKQQPNYKTAIDRLEGEGIVVADLTGVHQELLKHKPFADMTGNNINHPNDFLIRWYAQYITGLLVP